MSKTVVITGGAMGQGLSHAVAFAKLNYNVVIGDLYSPEDSHMQTAVKQIEEAGGKALAVTCDVTKEDQVADMFAKAAKEFGTIDVVISNAGIMTFGKTWELDEKTVWKTIDVNLMGTWRVNKEAAKYMMAQKSGRIINISSTAGLKGTPTLGHYTMSKFGVIGLTKTLAKELAKYGVTVNVICPTMVKTPMTERPEFISYINGMKGTNFKTFEEMNDALCKSRAMGIAFVEPEDVSKLVVWVATSDEARLITGASLPLDAGSLL
jgi:NAD(P)-dependent dehydrogenase (short-subunit alcohol dehydrogenase family)